VLALEHVARIGVVFVPLLDRQVGWFRLINAAE
jgi:hypothetical protein